MQPADRYREDAFFDESGAAEERRAHPRLRCKGTARMQVLPDGKKIEGALINLSQGGCLIETESPLPFEAGVSVELHLHVSSFTLRQLGVICRIEDEYYAGIEFSEVSSRKSEQIRVLIEELVELRP